MNRIYELRTQNKMTVTCLAQNVGVTQRAINNYEAGTRTPNVYIAMRLAEALNTSVDQLFIKESIAN